MIGRALDRLIDNGIIAAGDLANRFLDHYWPMKVEDRAKFAAEVLANTEAEQEVWEPDELWAATNVKRPFEDTDDFAEPVGEHPDIDPQAVIGKRQQWDGIGGHPVNPAGVVSPPTDTSRATNNVAVVKKILDHRFDTVGPYDKWLTETAVEILNALHK